MIKVEITDGNTTFLLSPHSIEIPDVRNMNESLQHEEQTCKMTAVFDVDLLSLLMNHADLQACVSDGETSLFTGFVDNNTDFTDAVMTFGYAMDVHSRDGSGEDGFRGESARWYTIVLLH